MALFFSGFVFFRNLLAPSHNGISFRKIRVGEGKRQDLTLGSLPAKLCKPMPSPASTARARSPARR